MTCPHPFALALLTTSALLLSGCLLGEGICNRDPTDPVCCDSCQRDPSLAGCDQTCAEPTCDCAAIPDGGADGGDASDAGPCGMACTGATPVCDTSSGTCVECLGASDCSSPTAMCDTSSNTCVACLADGDCTDPSAARCDMGMCVPCTANEQCTEAGAGLCSSGTCVECTVGDESPCIDNSCDPATNTCTTTPRGMTPTCVACVADSECTADHRCVPMTFMGAAHGNYCMKTASTGCSRPFFTALVDRVSLSGAAEADYCGIDESSVSCEAVRALRTSRGCPGGVAECMADGARCEMVGLAPNRCTYACGVNDHCPSGINCASGYCGG